MPGRRLFNINFNIGGNARTSVVTARRAVRELRTSSARGRQPLTRGPEASDTNRFRHAHTARSAVHILSGGGIVAQRARPGCWHAHGPRAARPRLPPPHCSTACAPCQTEFQALLE